MLLQPRPGGHWRNVRVRVGPHVPPAPELVPRLMLQLFTAYHGKIRDVQTLQDWYFDFNRWPRQS